ncbi:YdiU family protein [Halomonas sp. Bachu 37]|uniref:protein adenylyltransferase SelO n=1 Tax=Halomonas kashgarensis TaxID=3084920 RepID=UPI003216F4C3
MWLNFDHHYRELPAACWKDSSPTPVAEPRLVAFNTALAHRLGMQEQPDDSHLTQWLSGNEVPPGAKPLAMAYAGHQFGNFVPQLGDGRALLLGEVRDQDGRLQDVQLKGAGRTPFSRGGDGRAPLGPVLREYLVSEAMQALDIPTTRALAAVTTGERVRRRVVEPGAVLTRVASSHVRIGTFQYLAARGDIEALQELADHVIGRHYPELAERPDEERYLALLDAIVRRQAYLVARWMGVGFIHGVMNTDNMSVTGETIDYGPCAFMERFHPNTVFSSIDEGRRYAYANQPAIAQWNLARLAETLLPLIDEDGDRAVARATEVIEAFSAYFEAQWLSVLATKLGLDHEARPDATRALGDEFQAVMKAGRMDFTLSFYRLYQLAAAMNTPAYPQVREDILALGEAPEPLTVWLERWEAYHAEVGVLEGPRLDRMRRANPMLIPRNHRIEEVIAAAVEQNDFTPFRTLLSLLVKPYDDTDEAREWALPAQPGQEVLRTFCGT